MMELIHSEAEALFGGNLLEEGPHTWGHETGLFNELVDNISTYGMSAAPQCCEEKENGFSLFTVVDMSQPANEADWIKETDLNIFSDMISSDPVHTAHKEDIFTSSKVDDQPPFINEHNFSKCGQPLSPTGSYDSGVSSPGSAESYFSSSSSENTSSPSFDVNFSATQDFEISEDLLHELGISILPEGNSTLQPPTPPVLPTKIEQDSLEQLLPSQALDEKTTDLKNLLTTNNVLFESAFPSQTVLEDITNKTPSKPRSGRKGKITSSQDKKQRKRNQNKVAAARYRDRRRKEQEERLEEFNKLMTKNKSLHNKLSQITNEIDYIKELMIEVYTIKGVI